MTWLFRYFHALWCPNSKTNCFVWLGRGATGNITQKSSQSHILNGLHQISNGREMGSLSILDNRGVINWNGTKQFNWNPNDASPDAKYVWKICLHLGHYWAKSKQIWWIFHTSFASERWWSMFISHGRLDHGRSQGTETHHKPSEPCQICPQPTQMWHKITWNRLAMERAWVNMKTSNLSVRYVDVHSKTAFLHVLRSIDSRAL